jgi:hypothetical protein
MAKVKMLFKLDAAAVASGEAKHPTNYRGISLLDCIGKTFERVLHRRMMQYVDKFNLLDDNQNGFRPERSTEMHLLALEELLIGGGTDLPVCFLDIRKAFPSVRRSSLLKALHNMGFKGAIWKVIQSMYEDNISFVECGAGKSVEYGVHNGIREGAILSPLLYIIFINELLMRIQKSQKGSHVGNVSAAALAFADDIALIGLPATRDSKGVHLQQLLDIRNTFADEHMFHFGFKKTKVVVFFPSQSAPPAPKWILPAMADPPEGTTQPTVVEQVADYTTYLGLVFSHDLKWNEHVTRVVMPGIDATLGRLKSHLTAHDMLSPKTAMMIIRSLAVSKFKYGCAIWATDLFPPRAAQRTRLQKTYWESVDDLFKSALFKVLVLPLHANKLAVYRELGWEGLEYEVAKCKLGLLQKISGLGDGRLPKLLLQCRVSSVTLEGGCCKLSHTSLKSRVWSSYFVHDCFNLRLEMPMSAHLPLIMTQRLEKLPTAMYTRLNKCTRPPGSSKFAPVQRAPYIVYCETCSGLGAHRRRFML